jgi:hypothetical protein
MLRVKGREMEVLLSPREKALSTEWPVALRYSISDRGEIYPDVDVPDVTDQFFRGGKQVRITRLDSSARDQVTRITPLAERDAFLSFARLAKRGEPSEDAIMNWVHKYGLLRRLDPYSDDEVVFQWDMEGPGRRVLNQKPMSLEEFRMEARHAYYLLDQFETIRDRDARALRERISVKVTRSSGDLDTSGVIAQHLDIGDLSMGALVSNVDEMASPNEAEVTDEWLLGWCRMVLENSIEREIEEVRQTFGPDGKLVDSCPDLRTALYLQLARLVGSHRPVDICEGCGGIFTKRRRDQKVCDSTCRSRKWRKKEKEQKKDGED